MKQIEMNELLQGTGVATRSEASAEILKKFGLDWKVAKEPLFLKGELETNQFALRNTESGKIYNTCTSDYEVFQNHELLELITTAAGELGLSVDRGGSFKDGALVYLQIKSASLKGIGKNHDTMDSWITGINSHDRRTTLRWGSKGVVISCQNSFWHVYSLLSERVRHTQNMRVKIQDIIRNIQIVQQNEKQLHETFMKLSEIPATKHRVQHTTKLALGMADGDTRENMTRAQLVKLEDLTKSIAAEMDQKGETLWGLLNGVTYFTTHLLKGKTEQEQSKTIGSGYYADHKVFSYLTEAIK